MPPFQFCWFLLFFIIRFKSPKTIILHTKIGNVFDDSKQFSRFFTSFKWLWRFKRLNKRHKLSKRPPMIVFEAYQIILRLCSYQVIGVLWSLLLKIEWLLKACNGQKCSSLIKLLMIIAGFSIFQIYGIWSRNYPEATKLTSK